METQTFAPVYFNSTNKTVINYEYNVEQLIIRLMMDLVG